MIRVLTDADVSACLPSLADAIDLMDEGLTALAEGRADVRAKQGVSSREGAFSDAMPAALADRKLLGLKWISLFPGNVARGLPTASGVMVLNDADTGEPSLLMPAGTLTAMRTCAVSAATARALHPGGPVAIIGAGLQARWHVRAFTEIGAGPIRVWARRREQAEQVRADCARFAAVEAHTDRAAALDGAGTVLTALSIGLTDTAIPVEEVDRQALLLPIDYASSIGPALARTGVLAADDVDQFRTIRDTRGKLGDYPDPTQWTGDLIRGARPAGRVVVQNLGSAVNDLLLAGAVAQGAVATGAGALVRF